jgi:hypothetical protein
MDNDKKIMLCSLSLARIAQDLKELSLEETGIVDAGAVMVLALAQHLASKVQEVPEAVVHNVDTESIHDTKIGEEISAIAEQIRNEDV